MRIENVCRIRKAELGHSGVVGGLRGHEACDQRYVRSHIQVWPDLIQRLHCDRTHHARRRKEAWTHTHT